MTTLSLDPAGLVTRDVYDALGALRGDDALPQLLTSAITQWHAALLRTPRDVWELQERRRFAGLSLGEIPRDLPACLRYVVESVPAYERQRRPVVLDVQHPLAGRAVVTLMLEPRGDEDPDLELRTSPPFVVHVQQVQHVQQEVLWRVVPNHAGAFPLPGLAWGVLNWMWDGDPERHAVRLELRIDAAADPRTADALDCRLRNVAHIVSSDTTRTPGLLALTIDIPAATFAGHNTALVEELCACSIVRQVWVADAS